MGEEGFSSDSSLLYHRNIPSAVAEYRVWNVGDLATTPNHPLLPLHLKPHDLFPASVVKDTDVVTGRRLLLGNGDVRLSYAVAGAPSPWYRNGIGDECVYVERGRALPVHARHLGGDAAPPRKRAWAWLGAGRGHQRRHARSGHA